MHAYAVAVVAPPHADHPDVHFFEVAPARVMVPSGKADSGTAFGDNRGRRAAGARPAPYRGLTATAAATRHHSRMRFVSLDTFVLAILIVYVSEPRVRVVTVPAPVPIPMLLAESTRATVGPEPQQMGQGEVRRAVEAVSTDDCVRFDEVTDDARANHIPLTGYAVPNYACSVLAAAPGTHAHYFIAELLYLSPGLEHRASVVRLVPAADADDALRRRDAFEVAGFPRASILLGR